MYFKLFVTTLTADAAAELLTNLNDPQLEDLLQDFNLMKPQIKDRKSLQYFCKKCLRFKASTQRFNDLNESNQRWYVMCAGCSTNYVVETNACSIIHCPKCTLLGVDISMCAFCYRIHVGGKLQFAGITEDAHLCPRDCGLPFHSDVEKKSATHACLLLYSLNSSKFAT